MTSLKNFRIAYSNYNSSFSELLEMANERTIDIRNLKFIVTQIYKLLNGLIFPLIMSEILQTNDCFYDLRNPRILASNHKSIIKSIKLPLRFLKFGKTFL